QRQRSQTVPTGIGQGHRLALLGTVQRHRTIRDTTGHRGAGDLVVPGGDIPGVQRVAQDLGGSGTRTSGGGHGGPLDVSTGVSGHPEMKMGKVKGNRKPKLTMLIVSLPGTRIAM